MYLKTYFILSLSFLLNVGFVSGNELNSKELYVNALASMTYHLNHCRQSYLDNVDDKDTIIFTDANVQQLWDRINELSLKKNLALSAYLNYELSQRLLQEGNLEAAETAITKAYVEIDSLWEDSIKHELGYDLFNYTAERSRVDYSPYPHLNDKMKHAFAHFLISDSHPMKSRLDKIFEKTRVTANHKSLASAGFTIVSERPRSFVLVVKNKNLPKHLVKCYLDSEKREKWHKPSWMWLTQRCIGAKAVKKIIEAKKSKYFDVATKHLYILPLLQKKPPYSSIYMRHPVLLIATDMKLVSKKDNRYAWQNIMNKNALDELYIICSRARGCSYRADNIAYSYSKKFCFIDTEYPNCGPEFHRIGRELSFEMAQYWNKLVTNGGPK